MSKNNKPIILDRNKHAHKFWFVYAFTFVAITTSLIIILGVLTNEYIQVLQEELNAQHESMNIPCDVECEIKKQAVAHGVNKELALRIGECESRLDPYAANPNSSAKGVYQFIDGTWNGYCEGEVFNYQDNVSCFMDVYPQHPTWWECS